MTQTHILDTLTSNDYDKAVRGLLRDQEEPTPLRGLIHDATAWLTVDKTAGVDTTDVGERVYAAAERLTAAGILHRHDGGGTTDIPRATGQDYFPAFWYELTGQEGQQ